MMLLNDLFERLRGQLQTWLASLSGAQVVHRRRRRANRWLVSGQGRNADVYLRWATLAGLALCAVMFLVGTIRLIGYGLDALSSMATSHQLRQAYYDTASVPPTRTPAPATPQPPQGALSTAAAGETAVPAAHPDGTAQSQEPNTTELPLTLKMLAYPEDHDPAVIIRLDNIRRQNRDIVGWLTIERLIDEAVVQRDNIFYMNHDHLGNPNVNGAIFLDEIISLENRRPYTLLLYGHNMKSGAMFGSLRNYETLSFYKNNPFISFDTLYESGRYVIFAVGTVNTNPADPFYLDVGKLTGSQVQPRFEMLTMLQDTSLIISGVTVRPDDQVLLLITCMGEDSERRVIAARRLRKGETEAEALAAVQTSHFR